VVSTFWNWDFMKRPLVHGNPSGFSPEEVTVGFESISVRNRGVSKPQKQISARLPITGVPPEYTLTIDEIDTKLFTASGEPVPTLSRGQVWNDFNRMSVFDAMNVALGGTTLFFNKGGTSKQPSGELFAVSDAIFAKYAGEPLRLDTQLRMSAFRYEITAAMPPKVGERYVSGSFLIVVADLSLEPDGVALLLHERWTELRLAPSYNLRSVDFVLLNAKRGEAVLAESNGNEFIAANNLRFRLLRLSFTPKDEGKRSPDIDEEWLAEAELLRLELRPVAEFMHELQDNDFRMEIRKATPKATREEIMD
jgi:hypothetical protein